MGEFRRLPNLAALRAFEAAARHQNFSRAAEEVHLTHGAISHQVRQLEEELGLALFVRHGKRIVVTDEGAHFAQTVRAALQEIATAADMLRARNRQKRLTVTALPSFAARWLSPRLGRFIEAYPELEVSLQSSSYLSDYVRESIDIGIRFGQGEYPGMVSEHLMNDVYYPVASPHFNHGAVPRTPAEIAQSQLLRCDEEPWLPWFRAAALDDPEPGAGLVFQDSSMLVRAAVEGHGIALARHVIACADISNGDLLRLSPISVPCPSRYYLVYHASALEKPQVQAFRNWLLAEVAKSDCRVE